MPDRKIALLREQLAAAQAELLEALDEADMTINDLAQLFQSHMRGSDLVAYREAHVMLQAVTKYLSGAERSSEGSPYAFHSDQVAWHEINGNERQRLADTYNHSNQHYAIAPEDRVLQAKPAKIAYTDALGFERYLKLQRVVKQDGTEFYLGSITQFGIDRDTSKFSAPAIRRESSHDYDAQRDIPLCIYPSVNDNGDRLLNATLYRDDVPITLSNDKMMWDIQLLAIHARGMNLQDHPRQSNELIVYATGTGKSFVILNAIKAEGKKGTIITKDVSLADGLAREIEGFMDDTAVTQSYELRETLKEQLGEPLFIQDRLAQDLPPLLGAEQRRIVQAAIEDAQEAGILIICKDDLEWLGEFVQDQHVFIDEAHELAYDDLEYIAGRNDVLAITATPTQELIELFGDPVVEINMWMALNKLKAFRQFDVGQSQPLPFDPDYDTKTATPEQEEEDLQAYVFETLAGYFGSVTSEQPGDWEHVYPHDLPLEDPHEQLMAAMRHNQIYHSQQGLGAAFAIRPDIVRTIASTLQDGIFETNRVVINGWDRTDEMLDEIYARRVVSALSEYYAFGFDHAKTQEAQEWYFTALKELKTLDGTVHQLNDATYDAYRQEPFSPSQTPASLAVYLGDLETAFGADTTMLEEGGVITSRDNIDLQQGAHHALKHSLALEISILALHEATGLAKKEIRRQMHALQRDDEGTVILNDNTGHARCQAEEMDVDPAAYARALKKILQRYGMGTRQASAYTDRLMGGMGGDWRPLTPEDIDLSRFPNAEYAMSVEDETYEGKAIDQRTKEISDNLFLGQTVFATNNYQFVTGFSHPELNYETRIVEHVGDHVIRATQMLGRIIREKFGRGQAREILGRMVNPLGELGLNKLLSFIDIMGPDYGELATLYNANLPEERRDRPTPVIPDEIRLAANDNNPADDELADLGGETAKTTRRVGE